MNNKEMASQKLFMAIEGPDKTQQELDEIIPK
jgi:hypothetical protein